MKDLYKNHPNALWHKSGKNDLAPRRILIAFVLNTLFSIIEMIGGVLTGSVAIVADAVHDLGDSVSLGVAWYLERVSKKEGDNIFSYGYERFSLLSAVISGVVIIAGMVYVLVESIQRFSEPTNPSGLGMVALAILGIIVNGAAAFYLSGGKTQNEKILTWHLLEDVLGWVAVLIGALLIMAFGWTWIDPLLAVMIALYVGYNAVKNLKNSLKLMLQSVPEGFDVEQFIADVENIENLEKAHDLHVWSMDGNKHILSLHLVVADSESNFDDITMKVREVIKKYGEFHATIEVGKKKDEHYKS